MPTERPLAEGGDRPSEPPQGAYPKEITPALREVLGLMVMTTCPIAHGMRAAGEPIPPKTEAEQAHVLHWLIGIALEHGDNWRKVASDHLKVVYEKAKAGQP